MNGVKCFGWRLAKTSRRRCTLSKGAYCSVSVPHGSDGSNNGTSNARESPKVSLPTVSAPDELQDALDKVLDAYPAKKLVSDGRLLYRHLTSRKTLSRVQESRRRRGLLRVTPVRIWSESQNNSTSETVESVVRYGSREVIAYAASRLQGTYGATLRVLNEIAVRDPSFHPETMLDFGSGLGTAVWAAHRLWYDSLFEVLTVDTSSDMGDLARRLRTVSACEEGVTLCGWLGGGGEEGEGEGREALPGVYFRQFLPTSNMVQYDIVTACYTLSDLPTYNIKKLSLAALWRKTKKYLVLLELGNDVGFQNILEARDMLLDAPNWALSQLSDSTLHEREELQGHVFAPCPHSHRCPLAPEKGVNLRRLCHFGQRVALDFSNSEVLKHKGHSVESFSYVILKKGKQEQREQYSRVLQPVKKRTKHVLTRQCSPDGKVRQVIYTKSKHRNMYRRSRQSKWGDLITYDQLKEGLSSEFQPEASGTSHTTDHEL